MFQIYRRLWYCFGIEGRAVVPRSEMPDKASISTTAHITTAAWHCQLFFGTFFSAHLCRLA
jgi:hypothetical protein